MTRPKAPISPAPADQEAVYPTRDWEVPASDAQGHGERISVRVPTGMAHLINLAVAGGKYPWKQPAECIRWCIDRGLKEINKQAKDPDFKSVHTTFGVFRRAQATQMEMLYCSRYLVELKDVLEKLIKDGALHGAARLLEDVRADLKDVEDPVWKQKFRDVIQHYQQVIDRAPPDRRMGGRPEEERPTGKPKLRVVP